MKKLALGLICTFAFVSLSSCSKSDDNGGNSQDGTYTVKLIGSSNVDIQQIVITKGDGTSETFTEEYGNSWEKEFTVKGGIMAGASAWTTDDSKGTLEGQLIKNGKVIKTSKSEGPMLAITLSSMN